MLVADINENSGKQTVDVMPESMKFHKVDVTKEKDWNLLVEVTQDAFGSIDCLVNNAGTTHRNKASISRPFSVTYPGCTEGLWLTNMRSQLWRSQSPISINASMSTSKAYISVLQLSFRTWFKEVGEAPSSTLLPSVQHDHVPVWCGTTVRRVPFGM